MAKMNMIAALNSALAHQLERDPNVVIFGEDVGYFGGVFRVTAGLQEKCIDISLAVEMMHYASTEGA